jgi:predicted RNA polymerase sigma factor
LNAARNPTRLDSQGNLLRLQDQDRTRWDKSMIARGMFHFAQSAAGDNLSEYHLQAGIAACHSAAKDYESTDWQKILLLYDRLIEFDQSPVVALNRAVAIANIRGPKAGLQAVRRVRDLNKLSAYYLLYAVLGEFEMKSGNLQAAAEQFRRSFELAETKSERAFLLKRLQRCADGQTA